MADPVSAPAPPRAVGVDPGAIERVLGQVWKEVVPAADSEHPAVTRACMSNLIVYGRASEEGSIPGEVAEVVARHPSRVLLLLETSDPRDLEAEVTALCHLGDGARSVCSEHVTLRAGGSEARRLAPTARSLLIGDLPTALWWASSEAPTSAAGLFGELGTMVNQVIYDSVGWPDPVRGVLSTADWVRGGRERHFISDLAWRRSEPIRHLLAQSLDPALLPGALERIVRVEIEHTPHALPQSWLVIGWLSRLLGWQPAGGQVAPGVEIQWGFRSDTGPVEVAVHRLPEGAPCIRSLRVVWEAHGERHALRIAAEAEGPLVCTLEGSAAPPRTLARPRQDRPRLVARQLQKLFHDPLFEDTLAVSRTMAETLLR